MKHLQQFDDFLNEGAFHVALFKARNEGLKEFEFKGKIFPVLKEKEKIDEEKIDEGFEVHYSDGVRGMQKFNDKSKALSFAKDKIKNGKGLKDIAVYNAASGFHSTSDEKYLIAWWGDGSYWDNVSKDDKDIKAKKIDESEEIDEAMVQVAGKSKPSGAQVLASLIIDSLIDNGYMKPGADKAKIALISEVQKIIMDNTF